jgi:hypothetical protein
VARGRNAESDDFEILYSSRRLNARTCFASAFARPYSGVEAPGLLHRACVELARSGGDADSVGEPLFVRASSVYSFPIAIRVTIFGSLTDRIVFEWTVWNRAPHGLSAELFMLLGECVAGAVGFAANGGDVDNAPPAFEALAELAWAAMPRRIHR